MGKGGCCHSHRIGPGRWTAGDRECPLKPSQRQEDTRRDEYLDDLPFSRAHSRTWTAPTGSPAGPHGADLLSPWGNTAMSIHLATAGLSRYLPCPVQAADHVDLPDRPTRGATRAAVPRRQVRASADRPHASSRPDGHRTHRSAVPAALTGTELRARTALPRPAGPSPTSTARLAASAVSTRATTSTTTSDVTSTTTTGVTRQQPPRSPPNDDLERHLNKRRKSSRHPDNASPATLKTTKITTPHTPQ
jgi:hypothetical protein